jgi:hypothetical protein
MDSFHDVILIKNFKYYFIIYFLNQVIIYYYFYYFNIFILNNMTLDVIIIFNMNFIILINMIIILIINVIIINFLIKYRLLSLANINLFYFSFNIYI